MLSAQKPPDETKRVAALHALSILDTEPEERFDRITRLAQRLFGTQIATVNLIDSDRHWFKSVQGLDAREGARDTSFCAHAILGEEAMVIEDATQDGRFADNPSVTGDPNVRFYAGQPLTAPGGERLGTLCVVDDKPRAGGEFDAEALRDLATMVEAEIASLSLAIGDELTGLSNRRGFEMLGERLLDAARRLELPVAVVYADLDNMKPINDRHGHEAGDRALVEIAGLLEGTLRDSDLIARLGGDEFCAILVGAESASAATALSRVEEALERRNAATPEPFELSLSLGVAESLPGAEAQLWELVGIADEGMLAAKRAKKSPREAGRGERAELRTELIEDEAGLVELIAPWDALAVAASRPYSAPAWMLAWWRHARPDGAGLRVVAVREGSELVGIAPFWALDADARHSDYEILGARLCAPSGPLAAAGREDEVCEAFAAALASARPRPSQVLLEDLVAPLGAGDRLAAAWPRRRPWVLASPPDPLRIITLKGLDYDGWLATLSSKFRQEARRQRRRLEEAGAEFVLAAPGEVDRALAAFDDLHGARLAERGGSDALVPGVGAMLAEVARELGPSGRLRIFTIEAEGKAVAVNIVLAAGDEASGWNSGFDESWQKLSPSLQLTLHAIGDAAERGDAEFNLGPGSQGYKQRLADGLQEFTYSRLVPRGARYPLIRLRLAPGQVRAGVAGRLSPDAKRRLRRFGRR